MLRSVFRRPSPAAVLALLVLVIIAAPLASAAEDAVKGSDARSAAEKKKSKTVERARFADKAKFAVNAGKVRGYSVGFAALPSRVVLTGKDGKFPKAVIPAGTQGPQGPQGPPGAAGGFSRTTLEYVKGEASTSGVTVVTAPCPSGATVTGGGHEVLLPTRSGQASAAERGSVEVLQTMPVPLANGTSGWKVQVVRTPPEIKFVNGVVQPNTSPPPSEKIVQVRAWAVCTSR